VSGIEKVSDYTELMNRIEKYKNVSKIFRQIIKHYDIATWCKILPVAT